MSRRYTVVVADPASGVERRANLPVRPIVAVVGAVVTLPVLIGMGAAWKAKSDVAALFTRTTARSSSRTPTTAQATEALAGQIDRSSRAIADLGARSALDPALARAMDKLPALVKARAMGGSTAARAPQAAQRSYAKTLAALANPEDTFGLLRTLLEGLESRLLAGAPRRRAAQCAGRRHAVDLAGARLAVVAMGSRVDPVTGGVRLPRRPRHRRRPGPAGLRHRRRHA